VVNEAAEVSAKLPKGVVRSVFTASLIALTDAAGNPAKVVVAATQEAGIVQLKISIVPNDTADLAMADSRVPGYRALQWADVQALADAEGVRLHHAFDSVRLAYGPALP